MTVFELITQLGSKGIKLWLDNGQLKFKAPKGALTPDLKAELVEKKEEVIQFLANTKVVEKDAIPQVERAAHMPLSFAQQRLWFADQLNPDSAAYNIPAALIIEGQLDQEALRRSFEYVIQRHESLRTTFSEENGEGVQVIHQLERFDLPEQDLSHLPDDEAMATAVAIAEEDIHSPFDLKTGPVIRCKLLRISDNQNVLIMNMHHIVSDGWSMNVLQQEMAQVYSAFCKGQPSPLAPLSIQYVDFAVWQRDEKQQAKLDEQLDYWQKQLAEAPRFLNLPTDHPRPEILGTEGANAELNISKELVDKLNQLAQTQGATLYMALMCAYKVLLAKYSGQYDIPVSVPVAGRNRVEVEPLIGFFVNSLVVRTEFDDNPSFLQLLEREKTAILGAFNNQDVPIEMVVGALKLERQLNYTPLRQAAFSLQNRNEKVESIRFEQIEFRPLDVELKTAKADVALMLGETADGISGMVEYNTELFNADTMDTFAKHFIQIIEQMVATPELPVKAFSLLSEDDLYGYLQLSRDDYEAVYPLSPMQKDLYLDTLINAEKVDNALSHGMLLHSAIDVALWEQALQVVADNNQGFRVELKACDLAYGEVVYQCIKREKAVNFYFEDLSGTELGKRLRDDELFRDTYGRDHGQRAYQFPTDDLFFFSLYKLDEETYYHLSATHHMFLDASGEGHFIKILFKAYESLVAGNLAEVASGATLPNNYQQFINEIIPATDRQEIIEYWRQRISHVETLHPITGKDAGKRTMEFVELSAAQWGEIETFCQQQKITTANYIKSIHALLLANYYQPDGDFCISETVAGRGKDYAATIGCFIQSFPFMFTPEAFAAENSLADLCQYSRSYKKQINQNQNFSLLERNKVLGKGYVDFQSNMLLGETTQGNFLHGKAEELEFYTNVQGVARLLTKVYPERTILELGYFSNQFESRDFLRRLLWVSQQVMAGCKTLGELQFVLPHESEQILQQWNPPKLSSHEHTVLELIQQRIHEQPNAVAVVDGEQTITYQELNQKANALAKVLVLEGAKANQLVGICANKSIDMIVGILGVLKAGSAYVPMDPNYPQDRLAYMLDNSQANLVIVQKDVAENLPATSAKSIFIEDIEGIEDVPSLPVVAPADLAYVIYTSGSTGQPKGVMNQHQALYVTYEGWKKDYHLEEVENPVYLQMASFSFDVCTGDWVRALCSGGTLVLCQKEQMMDPAQVVGLIERHGVTFAEFVPAVLRSVTEHLIHAGKDFAQLTHLVVGSDSWFAQDHERALSLCGKKTRLINSYGVTEATIDSTFFEGRLSDLANDGMVPIGKPFSSSQMVIVDQQNRLVPPGCTGELCLIGHDVAKGYWRDDERTAAAFVANPYADIGGERLYRTGDLARYYTADAAERVMDEGSIELLGRIGNQVKIRGFRVELGEIESSLAEIEGVKETAVIVLGDGNDKRLVAYLSLSGGNDVTAQDLRQDLKEQLPEHMVPAFYVFLDQLPVTPNGKIDRKALPEPVWEEMQEESIAPRNEMEEKLQNIWGDVLGREEIGVTTNFFEIGGHSLLATQVISRVRDIFQVEIPLRKLFEQPTIEGLAGMVVAGRESGLLHNAPPIVPVERTEDSPLSFAQHRLWFVDQLDPESSTYNIPAAMTLKGQLDVEILRRAFEKVVKRHEVLRTNFTEKDGLARLLVRDVERWELPMTDLTHLKSDAAAQETEVTRLVSEDAEKPFNLLTDWLFRTSLAKLEDEHYVLMVCLHHICSDGWSIGVLINEVTQIYDALVAGQESPLADLPIQYADFAAWQREWMQGGVLDEQLSYWKQRLKGAPDVLRLPTDRPRPEKQTFNGAHFPVEFSEELTKNINQFCKQYDVTPFVLMLSAYQLLLSRYCNQQDVCVGIPIANRNRAEIEGLIGFFINGLVIRTDLSRNSSVEQLLYQVKDHALGAFAHQDMPLDVLVDALQMERSSETSPGAQVAFAWQNTPQDDLSAALTGVRIEPVARKHQTAKYELTMLMAEYDSHVSGVAEYNTDLFDENTIAKMMQHLTRIVEIMVTHPEKHIDNIAFETEAELYKYFNKDPETCQVLRLSTMQRDMYLDSLVSEEFTQNSIGYYVELKAAVDVELWKSMLQQYSDAQSLLRVDVEPCDEPYMDVAYQIIDRNKPIDFEFVDLSDRGYAFEDFYDVCVEYVYKRIELGEDSLLKHYLFKAAEDRFYALITGHHLMLDGVGFSTFIELAPRYYDQLSKGLELEFAADVFPSYISLNRDTFDTQDVRGFWEDRCKNVEALDFSVAPGMKATTDEERLVSKGGKNLEIRKQLDYDTWVAVQKYCKSVRTSPAVLFKCLYALAVKVYCRAENDFTVGEFVSGRTKEHLTTLGCYFHLVPGVYPLEQLNGDQTLVELFKFSRANKKALAENENISNLLQQQMLPQSRTSFTYNFYHFLPTIEFQGEYARSQHLVPDLLGPTQLVVSTKDENLDLVLSFNPEVFSDLRLIDRLEYLAQQVVAGAETIGELEFVFPEEKEQQIAQWQGENKSSATENETVLDWIAKQVESVGDSTAVKFKQESLSYSELDEKSNQLAHYLMKAGVTQGARVAVCLDRSLEMMVAVLGVLKTGAAYIPLDSNYPSERLNFIIEDSEAPILVTQQCVKEKLTSFNGESVCLDTQWAQVAEQPTTAPNVRVSPEDIIYLIYTSGSTGKPKAAAVRHSGEVNLLSWYINELDISAADNSLLVSAFGFDLTQKNLFAVLAQGGTLVIPDMQEYDPELIAEAVASEKITLINCAPSAVYPLVGEDQSESELARLASLRYMILGGEPIRLENLTNWLNRSDHNCVVVNSYGPTECTDVVAFHKVDPAKDQAVLPIGRPIPNTQLYIINDDDQLVPPGVTGELCVAGICVGAGYLNRDTLNQKAFVNSPFGEGKLYRTGDIARYLSDGSIEYIGRKDFQVKMRGLRIELGEIEFALRQQVGVKDSLVTLKDDNLVAYVVTDTQFDTNQWKTGIRGYLPDYMIPSHLVALDSWPLTPNGKIDRNALPVPGGSQQQEFVAPRNEDEEKLARIWCDVLGVEKVGIHDNFFDLGGHSLLAARAAAKFRKEFEIDIPLRSLFDLHTIAQISEYIETVQWAVNSAKEAEQGADLNQGNDDNQNSDEGRVEGFL